MRIALAEAIVVHLPLYCERMTRAVHRANTIDEKMVVYRVELDSGVVGWGDEFRGPLEVDWLRGKNPVALMHDPRLGLGAQTALLDAVGKHAGVPVHALIGRQLRDRSPISWWAIDMSPADWAAEARESLRRGHTCFKMKARPWRDIVAQVETVGKVVPADFKLDIDFNGFLLTPARAELVLHQLDDHPNVGLYESPFYCHRDLDGARLLRERVRRPVVDHFDESYLHAQTIDGTVNDDTDIDTGWTVEYAIRFDDYPELSPKPAPEPGDSWRIGLHRCGGMTNPQYSQWSASRTERPNFHRPQDFGTLIFSGGPVR